MPKVQARPEATVARLHTSTAPAISHRLGSRSPRKPPSGEANKYTRMKVVPSQPPSSLLSEKASCTFFITPARM
jgi:hypothetical protein